MTALGALANGPSTFGESASGELYVASLNNGTLYHLQAAATPTPTRTATVTRTRTATPTRTQTPTPTASPTATATQPYNEYLPSILRHP